MRLTYLATALAVGAAMLPGGLRAQETDSTEIARLRGQIEAITREIEELRLGADVVAEADTGMLGLGPAASKVYRVRRGVSLAGYGEFLYENFARSRQDGTASGATDELDALRAIIYLGYKFDDKWLFNSEIEIEHGSTGESGSVSLEFGYIEYRASSAFGVRAGMLLPPMGFINELHEPPIFLGARRPQTEQRIIPSTWRENGVGIFGEASGFSYRAYLVNGFNGAGFNASGLRGGRQKGSQALAEDFGGVGRLDYAGVPGLLVGASAYYGQSGQDLGVGAATFIGSGHLEYKAYGVSFRGLVALATVDEADALNAANGLAGTDGVGDRLLGWYAELGYDVLRGARTTHQVIPYVRYERLNTHDRVPAGFTTDPARDQTFVTLGASWKPLPRIAVKADWAIQRNEADTGVDQFSLALGYLF